MKKNIDTKNRPEIERRSFICEIRAEQDDAGAIITGRPIVYNSVTDIGPFDEVIEAGALDGADLRDVVFLANHNFDMIPLARSRRNNANSTMQLSPDEAGLAIRVSLDTENNGTAKELYSAVSRGDIAGMSFAFRIEDERWEELDTDHPTRHILKISNVIEVSAVTWPAYNDTNIQARSRDALERARATMDIVRKQTADKSEELEILKLKAIIGGLTE